jgi:hypothetical protein
MAQERSCLRLRTTGVVYVNGLHAGSMKPDSGIGQNWSSGALRGLFVVQGAQQPLDDRCHGKGRTLAKDAGLSIAATAERLKRLAESGVVRGIAADLEVGKSGYFVRAIVGITAAHAGKKPLTRQIATGTGSIGVSSRGRGGLVPHDRDCPRPA